jgi:hypothetical protein
MGDKPPFLGTRLDDKVAPKPVVRDHGIRRLLMSHSWRPQRIVGVFQRLGAVNW